MSRELPLSVVECIQFIDFCTNFLAHNNSFTMHNLNQSEHQVLFGSPYFSSLKLHSSVKTSLFMLRPYLFPI